MFLVVMLLKPFNMTYTYDNSGHGNDNGKVNYVAGNKRPQQGSYKTWNGMERNQLGLAPVLN